MPLLLGEIDIINKFWWLQGNEYSARVSEIRIRRKNCGGGKPAKKCFSLRQETDLRAESGQGEISNFPVLQKIRSIEDSVVLRIF